MSVHARVTVYPEQAVREALTASYDDRVQVATEIVTEARADAPVLSGQYRDGITVQADGKQVRVVDEDPDAGFKEYGTADTDAHATLTQAAARHGRYSGIQPR
jgi:hypothetical protein